MLVHQGAFHQHWLEDKSQSLSISINIFYRSDRDVSQGKRFTFQHNSYSARCCSYSPVGQNDILLQWPSKSQRLHPILSKRSGLKCAKQQLPALLIVFFSLCMSLKYSAPLTVRNINLNYKGKITVKSVSLPGRSSALTAHVMEFIYTVWTRSCLVGARGLHYARSISRTIICRAIRLSNKDTDVDLRCYELFKWVESFGRTETT